MNTQPFGQTGQMIELCCEYLTVCCIWMCSCHVTYTLQSQSTLYICLNVRELPARNKCNIWSFDCNGIWIHNHLVCKGILNHLGKLAKWLSFVVSTYLYCAFNWMFLLCHIRISEWIHILYLPECQGAPCLKQVRYLKFKKVLNENSIIPDI